MKNREPTKKAEKRPETLNKRLGILRNFGSNEVGNREILTF